MFSFLSQLALRVSFVHVTVSMFWEFQRKFKALIDKVNRDSYVDSYIYTSLKQINIRAPVLFQLLPFDSRFQKLSATSIFGSRILSVIGMCFQIFIIGARISCLLLILLASDQIL